MLSKEVNKLKEELRDVFRERRSKPEVMQAVAVLLHNFQHLKGTYLQALINEFIVLHAEDDFEIMIHDDEITQIWTK